MMPFDIESSPDMEPETVEPEPVPMATEAPPVIEVKTEPEVEMTAPDAASSDARQLPSDAASSETGWPMAEE